jgi:cyclic pyranopterin phosphate synthase
MTFRPNAELMQDDEIIFFARLFASLGFNKIRLTGGEPTVRANIVDLVQGISDTPGIRSISITTNGILLAQLASPLAKAGLDRVNISLDTLDPEKFHRLTRWGKLEDVWAGVHAAEQAGLSPIKINAVVVRGYNERDILEVARLTMQHPWQVRFIEMMPFAGATEFQLNQIVDWQEMHQQIENELGPLEVVGNGQLDGEARLYHLPGAVGDIGFISSVTKPFCATCNRARLTADGRLRLCLLREKEINLLAPLRDGASLAELRQLILDGIWEKPWGHGLEQGVIPLNRVMSEIGG